MNLKTFTSCSWLLLAFLVFPVNAEKLVGEVSTKDDASTTAKRLDSNPPPSMDSPNFTRKPHVNKTTSKGDEGWFLQGDDGKTLENVVLLKQGDESTVIRKYKSAKGNPYRLWVDDGAGTFPVPLSSRDAFDNFLVHMGNRETKGKHWCEIVADPWSAWVGAAPAGCGVKTYTQTRNCNAASKADKPCPDACGGAVTQSRSQTVNNGPCCDATFYISGVKAEQYVKTCFKPKSYHAQNACGQVRNMFCLAEAPVAPVDPPTPVCDTVFMVAGKTVAAYAAECTLPSTFSAANECGDSASFACTKVPPAPVVIVPPPEPVCDSAYTVNGQSPASAAAACFIPNTVTATNACGQVKQIACTKTEVVMPRCDTTYMARGTTAAIAATQCWVGSRFAATNACGQSKAFYCTKERPVVVEPPTPPCDTTFMARGTTAAIAATRCWVGSRFAATNACGQSKAFYCTKERPVIVDPPKPVCDKAYTVNGQSPAAAAAACFIPNTVTATNACGDSRQVACTKTEVVIPPCDTTFMVGGRTAADFAGTCVAPGTFTASNACGVSKTVRCTKIAPPAGGTWSSPTHFRTTLGGRKGRKSPKSGACSPIGATYSYVGSSQKVNNGGDLGSRRKGHKKTQYRNTEYIQACR